jgi:hypothetical protein
MEERRAAPSDDIVRDLYLFFRLMCWKCGAEYWPSDVDAAQLTPGDKWDEQFALHFAPIAERLGWHSVAGNVFCQSCQPRSD